MSVTEGFGRVPAITTSSDYLLSNALSPLFPLTEGPTPTSRPVGVALPVRRLPLMEDEHDQSNNLKQDLTPSYLKAVDSSSDDESFYNQLPNTPPDPALSIQYPLPCDKEYHVFVTHSSHDTQLVKTKLIEPLTTPPYHMRVSCSSDFMVESGYNNDAIKHAMQKSCVVIVGVSEPYVQSQR